MMILFWFVSLTALLLKTSKCEPPVNSYLPPNVGSGGRPSSQYGTPDSSRSGSFGGFNPAGSGAQNQPTDNYNAPGNYPTNSLSPEYGVPGQDSTGFQRGGSRGRPGQVPSQQYGAPNQQGGSGNGNSPFRGRGSSQRPDTSYGAPSAGGFNGPQGQGSRQQFGGSPSSSYGTPDFGNDLDNKNENYRRSGVDESNEPAKYEFSYEVDDAESGSKFGHSERRDGDVTIGEYHVVLPDGRKQVVEYEADREGYKPQIRYEGSGGGSGSGFGRGSGSGRNQGYPGANANANAFTGSESGYPQQPGIAQGARYQQPGSGSGAGGYPSNGGGGSGYPSGAQGGRGRGFQGGGNNFQSTQGNGGYPSGRLEGVDGRNAPQGGSDGYPSGGPSGQRGSGY